jgi:acyl-CoA reductase-like NAD-dependent aldehyde dehydrogenase
MGGWMDVERWGLWIDGREVEGEGGWRVLRSPYDGSPIAEVAVAGPNDVRAAVGAAQAAFEGPLRRMSAYDRSAVLRRAAEGIAAARDAMVATMAREAGKPIRDCRVEVTRGPEVFELSAEAAKRLTGEVIPMDASSRGAGRFGFALRVPVGVVAAIGPFNAPLNLVSQKVAPALAAGNAVVLKPASQTPLTALRLARILQEAGLPDGALNVVVGPGGSVGDPLVADPRVRMVTFTGSLEVGRHLTEIAGVKKLALELGSTAPNIVCADADVAAAARALARAGFTAAGQACIAAQRLIVHRSVWDEFLAAFTPAVEALRMGDPMDEATDVGPMIAPSELERILAWIDEARRGGARILTGGHAEGTALAPTVVTDVTPDMRLFRDECFAPVVTLSPFEEDAEAVALANDSVFGLQAGVFTRSIERMLLYAEGLEFGSLWINDVSRFRQDNYPFGGVKQSGFGREGLPYAVLEMTELKFVGVRRG